MSHLPKKATRRALRPHWILVSLLGVAALMSPASKALAGDPGTAVDHLLSRLGQQLQDLREPPQAGAAKAAPALKLATGSMGLVLRSSGDRSDALASPALGALGGLVQDQLTSLLAALPFVTRVALLPVRSHAENLYAAQQRGLGSLLELELIFSRGELQLTGHWSNTWRNFWTGRSETASRSLLVSVRADRAALLLARSHLGGEPLTSQLHLRAIGTLPEHTLALAIGRLDNSGRTMVAALSDRSLALYSISPSLQRITRRDLGELPRALKRTRTPLSALAVGRIALAKGLVHRNQSYAQGEVLRLRYSQFDRVASTPDYPVAEGGGLTLYGQPERGGDRFGPSLRVSGPGIAKTIPLKEGFYEAALDHSGRQLLLLHAHARVERFLIKISGDEPQLRSVGLVPGPSGLGLALADLDHDGVPERLCSRASPASEGDAIELYDLQGGLRQSFSLPGPVEATARGDLNADGVDDLLIAVGSGEGQSLLFALGLNPQRPLPPETPERSHSPKGALP